LAQFDEALGMKDEAAKWRKELEARKQAEEPLRLDKTGASARPGAPGK